MNREQIKALLWLQWRVRVNQLHRAGLVNRVLLTVLASIAILLAFGAFVVCLMIGWLALSDASAGTILLVWDGVTVGFLAWWAFALLADLQRSDALSLDKLLHLPVSPAGAFAINYLGSWFNLTLMLTAPAMIGLSLGLVIARGASMLWLAPLLASFLLMVTALTHQFQGWLAALMANKRRRRMIVVLSTITLVLLSQAPGIITRTWKFNDVDPAQLRMAEERAELDRALAAREINRADYDQRFESLTHDYEARSEERSQQRMRELERKAWLANAILPPGWLPLGAMAAAEGRTTLVLPCVAGMTLIGALSLWRAYYTTLGIYLGRFTSNRRRPAAAVSQAAPAPSILRLPQGRILLLSDEASVVAVTAFRSFMRAPEVRMLLLSPIIMSVILGPMLMRLSLSDELRPLLAFAALALLLLTLGQLATNQFGFDRNAFQAFVLSGVPRREILLGKNVAIAPMTLGLGLAIAAILQAIWPMPIADLLAVPFEFLSTYLLFCLLANWVSIVAPTPVPAGTLRRSKASGIAILVQLFFGFVLFPLTMAVAMAPLGAQILTEKLGWTVGAPVCFVLSVAECAAVIFLYVRGLSWQGDLLQAREQAILAVVKSGVE